LDSLNKDILSALSQKDLTEKELIDKFWQYERAQLVKALSYLAGVEEKIIWKNKTTIQLR